MDRIESSVYTRQLRRVKSSGTTGREIVFGNDDATIQHDRLFRRDWSRRFEQHGFRLNTIAMRELHGRPRMETVLFRVVR